MATYLLDASGKYLTDANGIRMFALSPAAPGAASFDSNSGDGQVWTVADDTVMPPTYSTLTGSQPRGRQAQSVGATAGWRLPGFNDVDYTACALLETASFTPAYQSTAPYTPTVREAERVLVDRAANWRRPFVPPLSIDGYNVASTNLWWWNPVTLASGVSLNGGNFTGDMSAGPAIGPVVGGTENVLGATFAVAALRDLLVVGSQVWLADSGNNAIMRLGFDGLPADLPIPSTVNGGGSMYDPGTDTIWWASETSRTIRRFHADGSSAGADFTTLIPSHADGMALVGSEVWVVVPASSIVMRFNQDGTSAGANISIATPHLITVFGSHVWVGTSNDFSGVGTALDFSGTVLFTFPIFNGHNGMAVVGSHVWVTNSQLEAYDASGVRVAQYPVTGLVAKLAVVGPYVWVVKPNFSGVVSTTIAQYWPAPPLDGALPDIAPSYPLPYRVVVHYAPPAGGPDVWIAQDLGASVAAFFFDGASGGTVGVSSYRSIGGARVGSQAWIGDWATDHIRRYHLDGTSAGADLTGNGLNSINGLAVVGTQVWGCNIGADTISRFNFDGTVAGAVITGNGISSPLDAAQVASDEVWVVGFGNSNISRFHVDGTAIGFANYPELGNAQDICLAGSQVWVLDYGDPSIHRYHLDGTSAGAPLTGNGLSNTTSMRQVGSQVWVTNHDTPATVSRFNLDGTSAGAVLTTGLVNPTGIIIVA